METQTQKADLGTPRWGTGEEEGDDETNGERSMNAYTLPYIN